MTSVLGHGSIVHPCAASDQSIKTIRRAPTSLGRSTLVEPLSNRDHEVVSTSIIVGYDGTPAANLALDWAAHQADRQQSALVIVTCYDLPGSGEISFGFATE